MEIVRPTIDETAAALLRERSLATLSGGTGRANPETLRVLERSVERALTCADPCGACRQVSIKDVSKAAVSTLFGDISSARFALMSRLASPDRNVVFTMSTAGAGLDEEILREDRLLEKFVLDAVASELAEIIQEEVDLAWMREASSSGRQWSMRMSPGYCDWQLGGQRVLFRAIDSTEIGIRLTDNFLMIPRKSVSAAAVVASVVPVRIQCVTCRRDDCPFRRAPFEEDPEELLRRKPSGGGEETA
jgi:hypothetical protein